MLRDFLTSSLGLIVASLFGLFEFVNDLARFAASDEALRLYCDRADGAKTIMDPSGQRTGCNPLASNVLFLPDAPVTKAEGEEVVRQLKLQ